MKKYFLAILGIAFYLGNLSAQEAFMPEGKPILRIFSNYNSQFSDGGHASAFEINRVYLGYEYQFSENFSGTAVLDVGNPGVGKLQMTAYVKNAYLKYKKNKLTINAGMISTTQFKVQESAWGKRYIAKSFQDEFGFNSSADIGISAAYKITDFLSADVIVANGEGYKKIEADSIFRTGLGLTLSPIENLTIRAYYDLSPGDNLQSSIASFIGYEADRFSIGAEYVQQSQPDFVASRSWNGSSVYSTVNISDKTKAFGRYDRLTSNTVAGEAANWNFLGDGQWFIAGIEFVPVKGVKIAPNYQGWSPADNAQTYVSTFILNIEVKF